MINVTKTYLPPFEEYAAVLKRAWDKGWITNNGELVLELEQKLKEYLGVKHLLFCSNGTIVLQMALKALNITKEVITTPFSYVATTGAILWEQCKPVFADIDPVSFCIDANKIEGVITAETQAILVPHVYGMPCDIEMIEAIAVKYSLKVIYDGAHAFGCTYKGKSLLNYGDISTCSFHATKLFHTAEGGCIITNNDELAQKLYLYRQFGHIYDDYIDTGINAKNSEFHAAMGLCVLPRMADIIASRKKKSEHYDALLSKKITRLSVPENVAYNYGYYAVVFSTEKILIKVMNVLKQQDIICRRYFYPSLNELNYLDYQPCPVSESISKRVLCLPLFYEISQEVLDAIINTLNATVNE